MTNPPSSEKSTRLLMVALLVLSASTLHVEVLLTKFFANKLEHHYTFAVISLALLGLGAGGVYVQLRASTFFAGGPELARHLWRYALGYAIAVPLAVALFIALPLDPAAPGLVGDLALPVYFLLFALTFFPSGVCVSALLMAKGTRPTHVYFWDLAGAGAGALLGPFLLGPVGGYGSVAVASSLALIAALVMRKVAGGKVALAFGVAVGAWGLAALLMLSVPAALRAAVGFDILSFKHTELRSEFLSFGKPTQTYWNPIARVDVSPTGSSPIGGFRYGIARQFWQAPLMGRMVLVDGSANTRQYLFAERPDQTSILTSALWAAPYALRDRTDQALIIGPGGGIDILIAKLFGVAQVDALELNPDIYALLLGRPEDPESELYSKWLRTDEATKVNVLNVEARHYARAHHDANRYQVVLATGVDTLTAIQTAGNALSENFLYTREAVEDYVGLLQDGGVVALTHWHLEPPTLALRMFATYLDVLERAGVDKPGMRVCVLSEGFWESAILKKGRDFTPEEMARLRQFAHKNEFQIVYEPFMDDAAPHLRPGDLDFRRLARASTAERKLLMDGMPFDLTAATDSRPYFYWIRPTGARLSASDSGGWIFPQASVRWMTLVALIVCAAMLLAPALQMRRGQRLTTALASVPFFAATGLGFILAENALFLMLTLIVGGPLYSLSVVLPSVLIGYGLGSLLSRRVAPLTSRGALRLVMLYAAGFVLFGATMVWAMPSAIVLPTAARVLVAAVVVTPFGALLGLAAPWYMEMLKAQTTGSSSLAWMWGVSSAANVMGSLMFVPVCALLGAPGTFALAGALYVLALAWAAIEVVTRGLAVHDSFFSRTGAVGGA